MNQAYHIKKQKLICRTLHQIQNPVVTTRSSNLLIRVVTKIKLRHRNKTFDQKS